MNNNIHDIYELEDIAIFPIAPGYWIIIAIFILGICLLYCYKKYLNKKHNSWRWKADKDLNYLLTNQYINIIELHNIIKKIIINLYKRKDIAKLSDIELLKYLKKHDPNNYDWVANGEILLTIFAPKKAIRNSENIKELIKAIQKWL